MKTMEISRQLEWIVDSQTLVGFISKKLPMAKVKVVDRR
jgi:hypothetical protein